MLLTVHDGKGQKDRTVPLPERALPEIREHPIKSDIRGPSPVVPLASEPAPRIAIDPPLADSLVHGRVVIQYRAENLRIAGLLPLTDAVTKLPSFTDSNTADSQIDSQSLSHPSHALSLFH